MSTPLPAAFRLRDPAGTRVTPFELFFDLVFVFAVTQLSHRLLQHLTIGGAAQTALLLLAVWSAWIYTSWMTNWLDPGHLAVRLALIGVMLTAVVMAAAIPRSFEDRALWFAGGLVAMQVGRQAAVAVLARHHVVLGRNFLRIVVWLAGAGVLWIAGALAHGPARVSLWAAAVAVDWSAPWLGYPVPGLGRSRTDQWDIDGGHMAERCELFIIIALGESLLLTGATFSDLEPGGLSLTALAVAFLGTVAMWWIYFDRSAEAAAEAIAASEDPAWLGQVAYTYVHIPMVAGIIVTAVGDELVVAHAGGHVTGGTAAVVLGGPALFVAGHALFKRAVFGRFTRARLLALLALGALAPLYPVLTPLALAGATTMVLAVLALTDRFVARPRSGDQATIGHGASVDSLSG